ncbi:unnamed protein product [Phyllotreta striolata]|uniref:Uncharacterized protein n=1 Tax=Phyllotreta striolata TaxID=444603 RepID=A0A9N9XTY8_PHYSR|nr:unnamed protein product [Phyllotreta striolata]
MLNLSIILVNKNMKKIVFTLLISCIFVNVTSFFVCTPNYCTGVQCEEANCNSTQILVPKGSFCGCCPECYRKLNKGDTCNSPFIGVPFRGICADGLICGPNNKCIEKKI